MSFITRAFASMTRNFGKTLLLLLIVFILGVVISGAISVQQAILNTDTSIRAAVPPVATVEIDNEGLNRLYNETGVWPEMGDERLTIETLHEIGTLSYVRAYEISASGGMASRDIELYLSEDGWRDTWMDPWELVTLRGVQRSNFLDLAEERIELVQGRTFTDTEAETLTYMALVSENFARLNNLNIGSTLTLEDISWDYPDNGAITEDFFTEDNIRAYRTHDFEVIGIFSPTFEFNTGEMWMDQEASDRFQNTIIVPNAVIEASTAFAFEQAVEQNPGREDLQGDLSDWMWYMNVYMLYDAGDMDAFREAVEARAPEFYTALDAGGDFGDIAGALDSLTSIAGIILWVAIGAAVVILSLLITLLLRERRREIGVYLALGEKRAKVIAQMMTEVMVVALIAVVLSLVAGNVLAANISETMLRNSLVAGQNFDGSFSWGGALDQMGFTTGAPSVNEVIATYNVALDATTVAIFFIATISTVLVATILPMLYIVRLNPKKIML